MPAVLNDMSLGMPVEVGNISKALKKLWEKDNAMTRATHANLAIYSEAPDSLQENTKLISAFMESYACRAIVIAANPSARENHVEAWISAHCRVSKTGSKQVCSEQLSFSVQGPCTALLPNIVFSQLDSDLPFYLWWQGEFHAPMDAQLWAWVDRVIYDSHSWRDFGAQLELLETAQEEAHRRIVFCDLNWTRLDCIRVALAQFFDHPASHHHFAEIKSGEIDHAPGYRSTALLLAGWLAAQLGWKVDPRSHRDMLTCTDDEDRTLRLKLREVDGEPIGRVAILSGEVEFCVAHPAGADLLQVSRGQPGQNRAHQLMPAGGDELSTLLRNELMRGGPHRVYLRAVKAVRAIV